MTCTIIAVGTGKTSHNNFPLPGSSTELGLVTVVSILTYHRHMKKKQPMLLSSVGIIVMTKFGVHRPIENSHSKVISHRKFMISW